LKNPSRPVWFTIGQERLQHRHQQPVVNGLFGFGLDLFASMRPCPVFLPEEVPFFSD
jgi:hypothetical protein